MIRIAHLYPEELTLYGESGNIKALTYNLDKENIEYEVIRVDKDANLELDKYDFIYLGSGRPKFLDDIKKRLLPYKKEILNYIENGKIILATGNAISILDFLELYDVNRYENRIVYDVEATTSLCKGYIKGFQNTEYLIKDTKGIIFNIEKGMGNDLLLMEGFKHKNFYATSIIGPILARNDNLNNYFIDLLTNDHH